jgi:protease IV
MKRRSWILLTGILLLTCSNVSVGDESAQSTRRKRADWAVIEITGTYPETQQIPGLFGDLIESLATCQDRLHQATRDRSVKGVVLKITGVQVGWGKLNEIQSAIQEVKDAGKPVWAVLNDASMKDYLLATSCDRIIAPESATMMLTGLRAEVTFYRNLFELLDIQPDMLRVGAFKSAAEPYTRTEMSDEFRQEVEELLDDQFHSFVSQVAASRKIPEDTVRDIIDEGLLPGGRAKELGIIDAVAYDDQLTTLIADGNTSLDVRLMKDYRKKKPNTELDLFALMEILGGSVSKGSTRPRIAVLRAEGMIIDQNLPISLFGESSISSKKLVPLISKLGKDDNVKAIVLRVDSPGGSALASDLIWRALEATGKPVVASMGDVAASGGYYISMGADRIFAEPGTVTGSIGVVGGKISFEGLMKKAGVTTTVIRRGRNAGVMSITEAFTDSEREAMQSMLNEVYRLFTEKAAAGRNMDYETLETMARGRVYTGHRAKELGLVDDIGTLADAIAYARTLVDDPDGKLELENLPRPMSPMEMLFGQSQNSAKPPLVALQELLPQSVARVIRHAHVLQQLATEPALVVMPFSLTIE